MKTRSIITVVTLMAQGITDSSLKYHLQNAKSHGVSQKEIAAIITHVGFYAGWPKAWAVFNLAKEVWTPNEGDLPYENEAMRAHARSMVFPIGQPTPPSRNTSSDRAISPPFQPLRSAFTTSHSNPAAGTTGTFTMPSRAEVRSSSASQAADTIRKREKKRLR